jgi:hypothetical protein
MGRGRFERVTLSPERKSCNLKVTILFVFVYLRPGMRMYVFVVSMAI